MAFFPLALTVLFLHLAAFAVGGSSSEGLPSEQRVAVVAVGSGSEERLAGVRVVALPIGGGGIPTFGETGPDGTATLPLPPGRYRLMAEPPPGSRRIRSETDWTVSDDPTANTLTIELLEGCEVLIDVVDADGGAPVPGVRFEREAAGGGARFSLRAASESDGSSGAAVSGADGKLQALAPPGRCRIRFAGGASGSNHEPARPETDLLELPAGGTVRIRFEIRQRAAAAESGEEKESVVPNDGSRLLFVPRQPDAAEPLPPGAKPGTYRFTFSDRVRFSREPAYPVRVEIRPAREIEPTHGVLVAKGEPFRLEADLAPGEYIIGSRIPDNWPPRRYWDSTSLRLSIDESGHARLDEGRGLLHLLVMRSTSPDHMAVVEEKRPVLRWEPIEGAVRYGITSLIEEDLRTRKVIRYLDGAPMEGTEYAVEVDLAPGRVYEWSVAAVDASGEDFAYFSTGYFVTRDPETPRLGLEPRLVGRWEITDESRPMRIVLNDDGTAMALLGPSPVSGTYCFIARDVLAMHWPGHGHSGPMPFRLESDDTLVFGAAPDAADSHEMLKMRDVFRRVR